MTAPESDTAPSPFDQALDFVLRWEGGFVNDPNDPGGATNLGITQKVYDAFRTHHGLPLQSVQKLSRDEAGDIYQLEYWRAISGDKLPAPLGLVVFDSAVNLGVGRASRWLQKLAGVSQDGVIGQVTLHALQGRSPAELAGQFCDTREAYYREIGTGKLSRFLAGWLNRLNDLRKVAGVVAGASQV